MRCAWEDCGKESKQSQVDGAVFREAQKLPDASHNVKQATELEDKVLGALKFKVKVDGVAEADAKQVANDEGSSDAMAKEEALLYAKSTAPQLRDTGSSEKSVDAELPQAIKKKHLTARGSTAPQEGGPRRNRGN
jgi:hypothetical protein